MRSHSPGMPICEGLFVSICRMVISVYDSLLVKLPLRKTLVGPGFPPL